MVQRHSSNIKIIYFNKIGPRNCSNFSTLNVHVQRNCSNFSTLNVVDVKKVNDRIIVINIVIGEFIIVINAYASQVELDRSLKEKLWEDLEELVKWISRTEKVLTWEDLNGHVSKETDNYRTFHGFGERNKEGEAILNFTMAYDLFLDNTFFNKREEWSSETQINFFSWEGGSYKL